MAGRPRERALHLELEQRTRIYFEDDEHTVLDYVCAWLADGKTLRGLGNELSDKVNLDLSYEHVMRYLSKHFDRDEVRTRLAEAREQGAYAMADDAIEDAITLDDKDQAPVIRVRNDARHWTAQRFNRAQFGEPKAGVNLTLNVATLHLDALRAINAERNAAPALRESVEEPGMHARSTALQMLDVSTNAMSTKQNAIDNAIDFEIEDVSEVESAT